MFFRGTLVDCLVSKKQSNHNKIRRSSFIIFFKNNFKSNVNIQRFTKFKFQLGTILPPKRIFWGFDEREVHVSVFGVNFPAMENRPCSSSQNWPLKQRNEIKFNSCSSFDSSFKKFCKIYISFTSIPISRSNHHFKNLWVCVLAALNIFLR